MLITALLFGIFAAWLAALLLHRRGADVPIWWLRAPGIPIVHLGQQCVHDGAWFGRRSMPLASLQKLEYAYQAAVGFTAVWIFTAQDGSELVVPTYRAGLRRLLADLERELPGFSIARWKQAFAEGDVEDTLVLWQSASGATPGAHEHGVLSSSP